MKANYVIRATHFIEEFFPYFVKFEIAYAVALYNEKRHRNVIYKHGSTRRVLIISDYVIKWDYNPEGVRTFGGCEDEVRVYEQAKKDGYEYLFAPITRIVIKGYRFYIMPRIDTLAEESAYYCINEVIDDDAWFYISDELQISDIHDENWGWMDGEPILIDYACASKI